LRPSHRPYLGHAATGHRRALAARRPTRDRLERRQRGEERGVAGRCRLAASRRCRCLPSSLVRTGAAASCARRRTLHQDR
jgi:hypothetical protein